MKLTLKLILALLAILVLTLGTYSLVEVRQRTQQINDSAKELHAVLVSSSLPSLVKSPRNYDKKLMIASLMSLFENGNITEVTVFDDGGKPTLLLRRTSAAEVTKSSELKDSNVKNKERFESVDDLSDKLTYQQATKDFAIDATKPILPYNVLPSNWLYDVSDAQLGSTSKHLLIASLWEAESSPDKPQFLGHIKVEYSIAYLTAIVEQTRIRILAFGFALGAIILTFTFLFIRSAILVHLFKLQEAAHAIADGNLKEVEEKNSPDEIGKLTRAFNGMVDDLRQNIDRMKFIEKWSVDISSQITLWDLQKSVQLMSVELTKGKGTCNILMATSLFSGLPKAVEGFLSPLKKDVPDLSTFALNKEYAQTPHTRCLEVEASSSEHKLLALLVLKSSENSSLGEMDVVVSALRASIASSLENVSYVTQEREQARLKSELQTASLVQKTLLPTENHFECGHFEVAAHFQSASECGGDWWGYFPLANRRLLILLGDVTGHGTPSAFVTAVVKGYTDSIFKTPDIKADEILRELNIIVSMCSDGQLLMTMSACILDPTENKISYANAAHVPPYVIKGEGEKAGVPGSKKVNRIVRTGPRLGYSRDSSKPIGSGTDIGFHTIEVPFVPGDTLFLFSDGLTEANGDHPGEYGEKRVRKIFESSGTDNISYVKDKLLKSFNDFCGSHSLKDDVTFVFIKFQSVESAKSTQPLAEFFRNHA